MSLEAKQRRLNGSRITLTILGAFVVGIGYYSHFTSAWVKQAPGGVNDEKLYEFVCSNYSEFDDNCFEYVCYDRSKLDDGCPDIIEEWGFLFVITLTFAVTMLCNACACYCLLDIIFHWVSGLFLLAFGILYILSAKKISNILGSYGGLREVEKVIAGGLAIFLSDVHFYTGTLVLKVYWRSRSKPVVVNA